MTYKKYGCEQFLKEITETSNLYSDALTYTTDEFEILQKDFQKIQKETKRATLEDISTKAFLEHKNEKRIAIRNSSKLKKSTISKTSDELSHPSQIAPPISIPAPCIIHSFQKEKYNIYTSCNARVSKSKSNFVIPKPYGKPSPPVLESYTTLRNRVEEQLQALHKKKYKERLLASFSKPHTTSGKGKSAPTSAKGHSRALSQNGQN